MLARRADDAQVHSVLVVLSASRHVALAMRDVVEVMRPQVVESFPNAPSFVSGLSLARGRALPVFDLGALLSGVASTHTAKRFVTLRVGSRQVLLAVDAVVGVRQLSDSSLEELPPLLGADVQERFSGVSSIDESLLLQLDAARLIPVAAKLPQGEIPVGSEGCG